MPSPVLRKALTIAGVLLGGVAGALAVFLVILAITATVPERPVDTSSGNESSGPQNEAIHVYIGMLFGPLLAALGAGPWVHSSGGSPAPRRSRGRKSARFQGTRSPPPT